MNGEQWSLNERGLGVVRGMIACASELRIRVEPAAAGRAAVMDCGVEARGGLAAGLALARICTADLARVSIRQGRVGAIPLPFVEVMTDHPVAACLASQYAGWALQEGKFFAMGSGPMRAASGREPIFEKIGRRETSEAVVGVLESRKLPPPAIAEKIALACGAAVERVTLLVAPTASLAGGVQIVARSVETALHKLAELGFDLERIVSACGSAPLPPVAADDLSAIGRTNDAILYGAQVTLYVTGDDASLEAIGPSVPSSGSRDHGEPFAAIFRKYNHDFYAVDPLLFSPAAVVFQNLDSGGSHAFGEVCEDVLAQSFFA